MGRLFWKLFLAIFLAQLTASSGIGFIFWLHRGEREFRPAPPPALQNQSREPFQRDSGARPGAGFQAPEPEDFRRTPPGGPSEWPGPDRRGMPPPPIGLPWTPISACFIVSLIFAAVLARHLSRPIVGLRRAFDQVAAGQFGGLGKSRRPRWPDELSDLAIDFDRTAAQVKMLINNQRRLLHDVSHEVRSPLARMQLAIDLARQQPDKVSETMERLERESGRINRLVEELLTLSRLEVGAMGEGRDDVDLAELLQEVVEDARFEASARQCTVALESIEQATMLGHASLLQRAIENVIRNAIRHTASGSEIKISLRRDEACYRLSVDDCGNGVPDSALELIFDPFVRLHHAGNEGYGLGLAITRQTIEAHGGKVSASNRPQGGLRVEMSLPGS